MDNYIVRIYRRNVRHPDRLVGVVEKADDQNQRSFHTTRELLEILAESLSDGERRNHAEEKRTRRKEL